MNFFEPFSDFLQNWNLIDQILRSILLRQVCIIHFKRQDIFSRCELDSNWS